jgi:pilus assembly protein CpaE
VITVVSPKGGSGKTIVSTNLAVGLASRSPGNVVLLDLDLQFGDVSFALGVTPQHTIADAVSALDDLDATTLKVFLTRHPSGLYALCAPDEPAAGDAIPASAITTVIGLIASQFGYVVIDTAAGLGEHTLTALDQSTDLVLLSDMDVPSVRNLRKALDALDMLGMRSPARHFVLNRADSRVGLTKAGIAAAAGTTVDVELPSSRDVPLSLNEGRPLLFDNPRSPVARQLAALVERIVNANGGSAPGGRGGSA